MKVKELQHLLDALDPELDVMLYSEDKRLLDRSEASLFMNIKDSKPIKLGDRDGFNQTVILEATPDI